MVAAEDGSLSVASTGADATGAGSMLDESVPSLLQAQNLHFLCLCLFACSLCALHVRINMSFLKTEWQAMVAIHGNPGSQAK